jgi:hypothetical protein
LTLPGRKPQWEGKKKRESKREKVIMGHFCPACIIVFMALGKKLMIRLFSEGFVSRLSITETLFGLFNPKFI